MIQGSSLTVEKLTLSYKSSGLVFRDLSFHVSPGESVAILGPSGCGKTSLLQNIAALQKPQSGRVYLDGKELKKPCRDIGYILQSYGLFPWKTVLGNVCFGMKMRHIPRRQAHKKALEMIDRLGLGGHEKSYPHQLSGGMKQRVALARSLSLDLRLLLMDEPLSALDSYLKEDMKKLLIQLQQEYCYTQIVVTHSLDEALLFGQRIFILSQQPSEILHIITNPYAGKDTLKMDELEASAYFQLKKKIQQHLFSERKSA